MSIAPYTKPSSEEIRKQVALNRANGETEPGSTIELDLPSEEPEYHEWGSADEMYSSFKSISESWNKMLEPQVRVDKSADAIDREYKTFEFTKSIEPETTVEKSDFKIGNLTEIANFSQPKIESQAAESPKEESKTVAEQAPSSLSEFMSDVDFKKWGKKGVGAVFGIFKGLFGGLFGTVKEATKVEHKKTEAEHKADAKKAKQNAEKSAFYSRVDKAVAEARGAAQNTVAKVMVRLGVAGMGADAMNSMLGSNRNLNSEEMNVYTAFEVAKKAEEAKKAQEKQVKDMQMAESQGPAVNIDAAVEGGTGGGKANLSAVSAGG